tara:strand:+ start:385 stop:603 length:219 start_codon:yes stop_codon:yes gene_type:complete
MNLQNDHVNDTLVLDDIHNSSLMHIGVVKEESLEDEQSEKLDNSMIDKEQPRFSTESMIEALKEQESFDLSA